LVYHAERLTHPLRRTRPKGDPDPGWERINWDTALDLTAAALRRVADQQGPKAVVLTLASGSTTAIGDASRVIQRLANAFGTPNVGITLNLCGWGRAFATHYFAEFPEESAVFNAAMVAKAHGQVAGILASYDFSGFRMIGDIGGGAATCCMRCLMRYRRQAGCSSICHTS
jgi:hypothetical protein